MPGFKFAYRESGQPPLRRAFPLAKSMNGTGTPPAATLKAGDLVAYTTVAALTTSSSTVMRMQLAADKTANYEEGGVRVGTYGICDAEQATNSSGVAIGESQNGGIIYSTPMASMNPLHAGSGHSQMTFIEATPDTVFEAQLLSAAASLVAFQALKGTLAGVDISVSSGVSTYTVDSAESGEDLNLIIVNVDEKDLTFKRVFVKFRDQGLTPTGSYMQGKTGVPYTTQ